jgi:competence ComEA-like helix-hairpin-helix protein
VARYKKHIPEYLSFTRKERTGIIAVFVLILLLVLLPFLMPLFITEKTYDHTVFEKEIAALNIKQQDSPGNYTNRNFDENNYQNYYQPSENFFYNKQPKGELFYFDPNALAVDGWKKLGIREKTANTIQNYLSKGGHFNKPEDIARIWGLHEDEVNRLMPYVRIESSPANNFSTAKNQEVYKPYEKPGNHIADVNINEADTAAFIALPGIGSKLANRIVTFREKLGGFYSIDQVAETFALPDSTFQKIKNKLVITNREVKKLNINLATLDELKSHPYLRYNIANAMVQYRTQHGNFSSVSDIKKIMLITDEIFIKAAPYLTHQ